MAAAPSHAFMAPKEEKFMPNRYPGRCQHCGQHVAAEQGEAVKVAGKWKVQHLNCDDVPAAAEPEPPKRFPPTDEQQECLDLAVTGQNIVIEAGAGAGKTTTLRLIAEALTSKRMLYVAFNKAIVRDVERSMPNNVQPRTMHSLAYAVFGRPNQERMKMKRPRRRDVAAWLGIDTPMVFKQEDGSPPVTLSPERLSTVVLRAVRQYCRTADHRPNRFHFPRVDRIDPEGHYDNNLRLAAELEVAAERAWADICNPNGRLKYEHDHYLKQWALTHPRIDVDVVLFDEAQDADPVIAGIVEDQADHAQIIIVGDPNQQIYEWRGAIDALSNMGEEWPRARLTKSFRFGPDVARAANVILASLPTTLRIEGCGTFPSVVGPLEPGDEDVILCRTNFRAMREVMEAIERGQRPFLVGGGADIVAFCRAALDLEQGRSTEHPDLSAFDSWDQVVAFVKQDGDEDLDGLVKLVEEFGAQELIDALDGMKENGARPVVSTAHKAKGREWAKVRIADDFNQKDPTVEITASEYRLRYVAATRAKEHLDCTAFGRAWKTRYEKEEAR